MKMVGKEKMLRKRGGRTRAPMMVEGDKPKHHKMDRAGRRMGGAVGADKSPLTSAARLSPPVGEKGAVKTDAKDD
jgi:hypothetical protein